MKDCNWSILKVYFYFEIVISTFHISPLPLSPVPLRRYSNPLPRFQLAFQIIFDYFLKLILLLYYFPLTLFCNRRLWRRNGRLWEIANFSFKPRFVEPKLLILIIKILYFNSYTVKLKGMFLCFRWRQSSLEDVECSRVTETTYNPEHKKFGKYQTLLIAVYVYMYS